MKEVQIETEKIGSTKIKEQINYLDNCNKKFKKYPKITMSKKKEIIENILIYGFDKFISISDKNNIDDNCTVKIYYYVHGLRDSIKTDKILEEEWKNKDMLTQQVIDMIKTFCYYLNNYKIKNQILKLIHEIIDLYKEKTKIDLDEYVKVPKPKMEKKTVEDNLFRKILRHFVTIKDIIVTKTIYPKPKLINTRE